MVSADWVRRSALAAKISLSAFLSGVGVQAATASIPGLGTVGLEAATTANQGLDVVGARARDGEPTERGARLVTCRWLAATLGHGRSVKLCEQKQRLQAN